MVKEKGPAIKQLKRAQAHRGTWVRGLMGVSLAAWYRGLAVMEKLGTQWWKNTSRPKNERI